MGDKLGQGDYPFEPQKPSTPERNRTQDFTYDNNDNRLTGDGVTLSYNDQNKPLTVERNNVRSIFSYDANGNRYKQVKQQNGSVVSTTYYVGSFEREVTLSSTVDKTYIGDHTIKMKAHVGSLGNQSPFQHVLRDHLGSVDTLMDARTGAVLQHRGYDVFGRPRDIASGNTLLSSWQGVTKGYTDHEHLIDQELIHMNGRIYDFNIGRFLSVDPFLQFPENSQSANPYSYILNNPMSGVDPTGYRSEELDEVISGKAFEKLEKDESGNLYVTADGETYKLTSVSNGEKNFSISFDGNGGGTAQVGKTTGTVSLHKGNSSTNVDKVDISGSKRGEKKGKVHEADFEVVIADDFEDGWADPHYAAKAFYDRNEAAYQLTDKDSELMGFVVQGDNGNYYFTTAEKVSATFTVSALIRKPSGWGSRKSWNALTVHTHPGGHGNQEGFSKTDAQAVLSGSTAGYYVRPPKGDVRFINESIAKRTRERWGAKGESICSGGAPCMTPYGSSN